MVETIWLSPTVANDNAPFGGDDGVAGYAPLAIAGGIGAGATLYWVLGNHLGVPTVITNTSGATATPTGYTAVGFPGQTRTLADLYYNRYRDYDSTTGRYIQADPIGLEGGENPYLYVEGNPLKYTDPSGTTAAILPAIGFCAEPAGWIVCGGTAVAGAFYGAWKIGGYVGDAIGDAILASRECPRLQMAKRTQKERSTDVPSWSRSLSRDPNEDCKAFTKRVLDEKYGPGNWGSGPGSEYSQIFKRCQRR